MTAVILSPPSYYEVKADALIIRVDFMTHVPSYTIIIDRVMLPKHSDGETVGAPVRLPSFSTSLDNIKHRMVTVENTTLSVEQIAAFVKAVVDDLKAEGLSASS